MITHINHEETTFYEELQNCLELDLRDERGKLLDMPFALIGLTISLLRNRDGNLSSIHRSMKNKNQELCSFLRIAEKTVVSRSHLSILLQKVNLSVFETLLFKRYGIELSETEKQWFSGDGKELKGSIEKGDKRGDAIVQLVKHDDREVLGQSFYNGKKESEKPCLRQLLKDSGASNQKITLDALHLNPLTTNLINEEEGIYIIGLKGNQKNLLASMNSYAKQTAPIAQVKTEDKGHGRQEIRKYYQYDISSQDFDERWKKSDFKSLFKVERYRKIQRTGKESTSIDYYISNGKHDGKEDYFGAIRSHWSVETNNHVRDKTLREDQLRTKKKPAGKVLAGLRTLTIKLLGLVKPKNMVEQLELFSDHFHQLLHWLKSVNFL